MLWRVPYQLRSLLAEDFGRSMDELLLKFSDERLKHFGNEKTKWKVGPGINSTGRVAIAILHFDKATGETMAFGAIERDRAPAHVHPGGEIILTLSGVGDDINEEGEPIELLPGSIMTHRRGSIHTPGSRAFWVFAYQQPLGLRFINPA